MGWTGPMTYRQFLAWEEWLVLDLEDPGKADLYAAQTAMRVDLVLASADERRRAKLGDYVLSRGKSPAAVAGGVTAEDRVELSKQRALAAVGPDVTRVYISRREAGWE